MYLRSHVKCQTQRILFSEQCLHWNAIENIVIAKMPHQIAEIDARTAYRRRSNERKKKKLRGKKQINHFWAAQRRIKIRNDKELCEVKWSEQRENFLQLNFFFLSRWILNGTAKQKRTTWMLLQHSYDIKRIDSFFIYFSDCLFVSIIRGKKINAM